MSPDQAVLAALEPLPASGWDSVVLQAGRSAGLDVELDRRQPFVSVTRGTGRGYVFTDGVALRRLRLGHGRWALSATSRRVYFDPESGQPDRRPEHEIVGGRRPAGPDAQTALAGQFGVLEALRGTLEPAVQFVPVEQIPIAPTGALVGEASIDPSATFNSVYKTYGFDTVPDRWFVSVCPSDGVSHDVAADVARRLEVAAHHRAAPLEARVISLDRIEESIHSMSTEGRQPIGGRVVLFLLPRSDSPPSAEVLLTFQALDLLGVRYRRAYSTDPFEYSIPDQLPSILQASGGRPHRIELEHEGRPLWSVGVDLSHKIGAPKSTLAVSLIDPEGAHVGTWVRSQRRDETVSTEALQPLLRACAQKVDPGRTIGPPVMVLRDGRLFERESADMYRSLFPGPVSLFEYRKRGNPQVATGPSAPRLIPGPYAAVVAGTQSVLVAPSPARSAGALPAVAKVTWQPEWNQVGLTESDLAQALVSLTLAPGLGLHRRSVPAPIYWADGIAGADDADLRFRGNAAG